MLLSELLHILFQFNQPKKINLNIKNLAVFQKLESIHVIEQIETFASVNHFQKRVEENLEAVLSQEEMMWFVNLLQSRWQLIQGTTSCYSKNSNLAANQVCVALAEELTSEFSKSYTDLLMPKSTAMQLHGELAFIQSLLSDEQGIVLFCSKKSHFKSILELDSQYKKAFISVLYQSETGKVYLQNVLHSLRKDEKNDLQILLSELESQKKRVIDTEEEISEPRPKKIARVEISNASNQFLQDLENEAINQLAALNSEAFLPTTALVPDYNPLESIGNSVETSIKSILKTQKSHEKEKKPVLFNEIHTEINTNTFFKSSNNKDFSAVKRASHRDVSDYVTMLSKLQNALEEQSTEAHVLSQQVLVWLEDIKSEIDALENKNLDAYDKQISWYTNQFIQLQNYQKLIKPSLIEMEMDNALIETLQENNLNDLNPVNSDSIDVPAEKDKAFEENMLFDSQMPNHVLENNIPISTKSEGIFPSILKSDNISSNSQKHVVFSHTHSEKRSMTFYIRPSSVKSAYNPFASHTFIEACITLRDKLEFSPKSNKLIENTKMTLLSRMRKFESTHLNKLIRTYTIKNEADLLYIQHGIEVFEALSFTLGIRDNECSSTLFKMSQLYEKLHHQYESDKADLAVHLNRVI